MENKEGKTLQDTHRDATQKKRKEDRSVANLEYLESLHKRAKRKRQKEKDSTVALPPYDIPPKDTPPYDRPPDPPPPFRDKKQLEGAEKSPRGAEKSREKSRLVTGPHETGPPRIDMQLSKQGESKSLMQPQHHLHQNHALFLVRQSQVNQLAVCLPPHLEVYRWGW